MKYYAKRVTDTKLGDLLLQRNRSKVTLFKLCGSERHKLLQIDASLDTYTRIEDMFGSTYNNDAIVDKVVGNNVYIRLCDGNNFVNVAAKDKARELAKCTGVKFYPEGRNDLIDYINKFKKEKVTYTDGSKDLNTLLTMLMDVSSSEEMLVERMAVYSETQIVKMEYALGSSIWANMQDVYADGTLLAIRAGAVIMAQDDNLNFTVGQVNDDYTVRTVTVDDIDLTTIGDVTAMAEYDVY